MATLIISSFAPARCGIGVYAGQTYRRLLSLGQQVDVVTWGEGQGDVHLGPDLARGLRLWQLRKRTARYERVILQYTPSFFAGSGSRLDQAVSRIFLCLFFVITPNLTVLIHEFTHYPPKQSWKIRILWLLEWLQWSTAREILLHNEPALATFRAQFPLSPVRCRQTQHGQDFVPFFVGSQEQARARLGVGDRGLLLVSPGFISFYKGYQEAVRALARLHPSYLFEYVIVGAINPDTAARDQAYLDGLRAECENEPRLRILDRYLTDEEFDCWIAAADVVLLPYRSSTSSSVLARCHLLGRAAWVSCDAVGLVAECGENDSVFRTSEELLSLVEMRVPTSHMESL